MESSWRLDPGLAEELRELIGWDPAAGPAALVSALAGSLPVGSTAKREAVAAGEVPPGADPEAVARRVVEDRAAGRPTVSWSCWAMSSLMAALLEHTGAGPVAVAAVRRIDGGAPPVDVHSVVLVDGLICDPYLAAVVAGPGAEEREREHGGVWCRRTDEADGRWTVAIDTYRWRSGLAYRVLSPRLDGGDVAALCAVSVTHSGAPPLPFAVLWREGRGTDAIAHAAGGVAVRRWRPTGVAGGRTVGEATIVEHPGWAEATADFAAATGVRLA